MLIIVKLVMDTQSFISLFSTHLYMGKFCDSYKNRWEGKRSDHSDYKTTEYQSRWREGKKITNVGGSNQKKTILVQKRPLLVKSHQEKGDAGHSRVQR